MSMHVFCCCAKGCPETLEVTFSGVDAAICAACQRTGVFNSLTFNNSSIDGTYTVVFDQFIAGTCEYVMSPQTQSLSVQLHSGSTTCGGAGSADTIDLNLRVRLNNPGNTVNLVIFESLSSNIKWAAAFLASGLSDALGASISNALTCTPSFTGGTGYRSHYSNGGTAVVDLP